MSGSLVPDITHVNTVRSIYQLYDSVINGSTITTSTIVLNNDGALLTLNNLATVGPNDTSINLTYQDPSGSIISNILFAENSEILIAATSSITMNAAYVTALNTFLKPAGEVSTNTLFANYAEVSTINAYGAVDIDGQVLTATPTELLLNGVPLATTTNISSLAEWSYDPAISTINVNNNDIIDVNSIQIKNAYVNNVFATEIYCENLSATSTIQTYNILSTSVLTADVASTQSAFVSSINGYTINELLNSQSTNPLFSTVTVSSSIISQEANFSTINGYPIGDFLSTSITVPNGVFSTVTVSSLVTAQSGLFTTLNASALGGNNTQTSTLACALTANIGAQLTSNIFPIPSATYTDTAIKGNLKVAQWNNSAVPYPNIEFACDKFAVGNYIGQPGGENVPAVSINGRTVDVGSIGSSATTSLNGIATSINGSATAGITSPVTTLTGGIVNITGAGGVAVTGAGGVSVTGGTVSVTSPIGVSISGGGGVSVTGGLGVSVTSASVGITGGGSVSILGGGGISVGDLGGATFNGGEVGLQFGANLQMNTGTIYTGGSIINSNAGPNNWVKFRADSGIYVQDINASTPTSVYCGSVTLLDGTIPGSGVPLVLSNVSTTNLYANGELVAYRSQLSNWAYAPATSTINANGNDIINANDVIGIYADFDYISTNQIAASTMNTENLIVLSNATADSVSTNHVSTGELFVSSINAIPAAAYLTKSAYTSNFDSTALTTAPLIVQSTFITTDLPNGYVMAQINASLSNDANAYHDVYANLEINGVLGPSTFTSLLNKSNHYSFTTASFRQSVPPGTYQINAYMSVDAGTDVNVVGADMWAMGNLE